MPHMYHHTTPIMPDVSVIFHQHIHNILCSVYRMNANIPVVQLLELQTSMQNLSRFLVDKGHRLSEHVIQAIFQGVPHACFRGLEGDVGVKFRRSKHVPWFGVMINELMVEIFRVLDLRKKNAYRI